MKPFLGLDLTDNKNNEHINGTEFMVQKTSAALASTFEASKNRADQSADKAKLPLFLRITQLACAFSALICARGILKADVTLAQAYRNAPALFWVTGICAIIWLFLWLWGKQKSKTVMESDENAQAISHLNGVSNSIFAELSVPADAKSVDVLAFTYKIKKGEVKATERAMQIAPYGALEFKLFADAEYLYLANLEGKYALPLASIGKIQTVKKHIRVLGWNKGENFNKGIYKQYKLTTDQYGCVHSKYYHILEFNHNGEAWGLYFPCYELPNFEEIVK